MQVKLGRGLVVKNRNQTMAGLTHRFTGKFLCGTMHGESA